MDDVGKKGMFLHYGVVGSECCLCSFPSDGAGPSGQGRTEMKEVQTLRGIRGSYAFV